MSLCPLLMLSVQFQVVAPFNYVTMLQVDYIRENGSLLAHLGVPKPSQL